MTKYYCLGLLFDPACEWLLLIKKNRPRWMVDKWNGIGGKLEYNESPVTAMVRETKEEVGLHVNTWSRFLTMHGWHPVHGAYTVYVFAATSDLANFKQETDEELRRFYYKSLPMASDIELMPNMRWLSLMAHQHLTTCEKISGDVHVELSEAELNDLG